MMRMSMAGKIYSIVVLLLAVAIVILGLGVYSMNSMTTTMHGVIRQANRLINIGNIDRIALERRIAVVSIIDSGVEAVMKNILDNDMKNIETRMEAEFVAYRSNFDSPPVQTQIQYEKDLRQLWGDYVKVSSEVGALAYANTNNKALAINTDMRGFLDNADATFENIGNLLLEEGKHLNLLHDAMIIRAELLRYRTLVLRFISEHDAAVAQTLLEEIRGIVTHTVEGTAKLAAELTPATGKPAASALAAQLKDGAARIEELIGLSLQDTNVKAAQMLAEKGVPTRNKLAEYAGMVIANGAGAMRSAETAADTLARTMLLTMGVVGAVGIVLAIIISYITISAIVKRLNATIASLGDSSSHVNSASAQISHSAQGLAEGSTEQAASLEQTSSALEEMASMTRQNADNATKTNETTQGNNKLIALGSDAVKNMSQAMAEISDSAEQINRIIKTIEDIAFQTNLLALNAAVEAARAGEAGKGFAVVADEVRNLAGRSAQAARDTTQLIHTTIERVRNGSEIASELDSSFKEIEDGSHTVARLIAEITSATNEQAQGVDQVNTAVAQMDKVTQQNAASAEEAASASEELSAEANNLNGMVRDLVSMVEGKADGNAAVTKSGGGKDAARGGASKKKQAPGLETVAPTHANAAHSGVKQAAKVVSANDVIPLDENDDF